MTSTLVAALKRFSVVRAGFVLRDNDGAQLSDGVCCKQIPSPTPNQGRWAIDGVGLPREVLEAVYHGNAERLLGVKLPATAAGAP